jgi:hypothetical protein
MATVEIEEYTRMPTPTSNVIFFRVPSKLLDLSSKVKHSIPYYYPSEARIS